MIGIFGIAGCCSFAIPVHSLATGPRWRTRRPHSARPTSSVADELTVPSKLGATAPSESSASAWPAAVFSWPTPPEASVCGFTRRALPGIC
jgi:hypothetical protein